MPATSPTLVGLCCAGLCALARVSAGFRGWLARLARIFHRVVVELRLSTAERSIVCWPLPTESGQAVPQPLDGLWVMVTRPGRVG